MKKSKCMMRCVYFTIIFVLINSVSFGQNDNMEFKIKRKTPEPNTKLSFISKLVLKHTNRVILNGNPDSVTNNYFKKNPLFKNKCKYFFDQSICENNISVRFFYPKRINKVRASNDSILPVTIFYHGGGFIWGDNLDMFNLLAHKLSKKLNSIVVVPNYRLAPKHPFPAAVNDCIKTLDWVVENIHSLGGNPLKVSLIGESAGGNLTLITTLINNQRKTPHNINYQVLYNPSTSMADEPFDSRKYFFDSCGVWYVLNRPLLTKIKNDYLNGIKDTCWQVSPLYAKYNSKIPPTLILTAQCDPLRDEGNKLAEKMKNDGVNVQSFCYPKTIHGFVNFFPIIKQGRRAINKTKSFLEP